jgi:hypothetical protein
MAMASGCEAGWQSASDGMRSVSLVVELQKRSYVLPWSLFLYAEGTDEEVKAVFHTHVIVAEGAGLGSLLVEFSKQTLASLKEPGRSARFSGTPGPHLSSLTVSENK